MKEYKRTKLGKLFYNITITGSRFLMKNMWLYHLLSYTWGIITTFVGWICFGFVKLFLAKKITEKGVFGPAPYLMFGKNWGGLEMGTTFFVAGDMGEDWTLHTKCHELGHTFQNALWGPFAIFISFIPSVIRYWLDVAGKIEKDYDAIWFEGSATDVGIYYYNNYINKKQGNN